MTNAARLQIVVEADTSKAESGLQSLGQKVASFGQSFTQGLGIGAGIQAFQTGLEMISGSFGALKGSVIDFNQQLDQSRAVFTRYFNGSQEQADSFLNTLKGFAAQTPFEFKDLSQLATRLQNANTNANDIIPTIKAIGNAASASGSLSSASLDRITLALSQMQMKGKVTGEEMMQLTEAGVPAWNLLAEATGKSVPVLQDLASKGQISSDVLMKAFRGAYENAGLMEGASKSLTGALSTISDVGTQAFADIGRSIFELATDGANALATLLSSEAFGTWVQAAKVATDGVVAGIRSVLDVLAPVGQTIAQAFGQLTSGDFSGAFGTLATGVQTALGGALESVQAFAAQMFGAGTNLVNELAGGIVDGASGILQGAIDTVASMIASFLIGNSPPPEGPLARIREGGANVIAAWGDGAASAADQAVKPAADKIAGGLDELKMSGRGVDDSIRDIGRSIADLDSQTSDLKFKVDDIKDAYKDQLDPLEAQLKAITSVKDLEAERQKIAFSLEEAQLRQAEIAAQGDPVRRRELQDRLDQLKARQDEVKTARELEDAEKAVGGSAKDKLKDQLESTRLAREEEALRAKLKGAKGDEKSGIQDRLAELELRKKIAAADDKEQQEKARRKQEDAQAHLDELNAKKAIGDLTDKDALARLKGQKDDLAARKEAYDVQQQQAKLEREQAALPIRAEIERVKAEQEATLKPLAEQLDSLTRQKAELSEQRQHYQAIKQEIAAATAAIKDQQAAAKASEKAAADAAKAAPTKAVDKTFTPDKLAEDAIKGAKESGAKLAGQLKDGFIGWITQNPIMTAGTLAGALFGAGQGAAIGASLGSVVPVIGTAIGGVLGAAIGAGIGGLAVGQLAGMLQKRLEEIMGTSVGEAFGWFASEMQEGFEAGGVLGVVETLTNALGDAISTGVPLLAGKLVQWTNAFLDWAGQMLPPILTGLAALVEGVVNWIGASAGPIADTLYEWSLALIDWVTESGPGLLSKLAGLLGQVLTWIGGAATYLSGKLVDWATAFVSWIGPKIPELLTKLGQMVVTLVEWIGSHTGDLLDALGAWATSFVEWVGPKIPPLLAELGKLLVELTRWTATVALPAIVSKLLEWGDAIIKWVGPRIGPLLGELGQLLLAVGAWFVTDALPAIGKGALAMGDALLRGLWDGISQTWTWLVARLGEFVGWVIDKVKQALGIASPSTVFKEIGVNVVQGLWDGMVALWDGGGDTLKGWLEGFGKLVTGAFGWTGQALSWAADMLSIGRSILDGLWTGIKNLWAGDGGETLKVWLGAFGGLVVGAVEAYGGGSAKWLVEIGGKILSGLKAGWDAMWSAGANGTGAVKEWLGNFGGSIVGAVQGWLAEGAKVVTDLLGVGGDLLMKIAEGFTGEGKLKEFKDWLKEKFVDLLPGWLKDLLDIHSPSGLMVPIGSALVDGIIQGMEDKFPVLKRVIDGIKGIMGGASGETVDIDEVIRQAMTYTKVPSSWFGGLRWIVEHEDASGDPGAKNPDSTATGLFQLIDSTWDAYKDPDLPDNVKNAFANAVAGIRYITDRYGTPDDAVDFWKANNYYEKGGRLPEDIFGQGRSGQTYMLHAGEGVFPPDLAAMLAPSQPGGGTVINLTVNVSSPLATPRQVADAVIPALEHAVSTRRLPPSVLGRT